MTIESRLFPYIEGEPPSPACGMAERKWIRYLYDCAARNVTPGTKDIKISSFDGNTQVRGLVIQKGVLFPNLKSDVYGEPTELVVTGDWAGTIAADLTSGMQITKLCIEGFWGMPAGDINRAISKSSFAMMLRPLTNRPDIFKDEKDPTLIQMKQMLQNDGRIDLIPDFDHLQPDWYTGMILYLLGKAGVSVEQETFIANATPVL